MTLSLATELEAIAEDFKSRRVEVGVNEIRETGAFIGVLAQSAQRIERELSIFRDIFEDAKRKGLMEEAATDNLEDMIADAKGKILRPDFSKGGRS
jgi:hypothetical protein